MLCLAGCAHYFPAGPSAGQLYTVTTDVMQKPGHPPRACFATPLPYPPIGCGGVALNGLDMLTMPGLRRYRNGVTSTAIVRLTGTWDGGALTLTRPPEAAPPKDATQLPSCADPGRSSADPLPPEMQMVMDDEALLRANGIQVLEFGPCGDSIFIVVAVADSKTVDFLTKRYRAVEVAGWLEPVR